MGWCVKPWGRARRRQRFGLRGATGLVSLWKLKSQQINGTPYVIDHVAGANNGTLVGSNGSDPQSFIDPILGPGMAFRQAAANYASIATTTGFTGAQGTAVIWFRAMPDPATGNMLAGYLWGSIGANPFELYMTAAGALQATLGTSVLFALGPSVALNRIYQIVLTWDVASTPVARTWVAYLNGTQVGTGQYTGDVTFAAGHAIGYDATAAASTFNGHLFEHRIYNRVLTAAEVAYLYREGSKAVLVKTDWGALQSPGAEGGIAGAYLDRTKWRFVDTTPRVSVQESITIGTEQIKHMIFGIGGGMYQATEDIGISSADAAYGTWEYLFYKNGDGDEVIFAPIASTPSATYAYNGYHVIADLNEALHLQRRTGLASLNIISTANAAISLQTWYIVRLTRRYDGLFSLYYAKADSASTFTLAGTATDTTYTTAPYRQITASSSSRICLGSRSGNHQISHRGGVISP